MFIESLFAPKKKSILDKTEMSLRVLPNDVDVKYMTNDRYLSIMDIGRIHFAFSIASLPFLIKKKWIPVATGVYMQYRFPLKIFQKYNLHTRIVWWDKRHFYLTQKFERNGKVVATGIVIATWMSKNKLLPSDEILTALKQNNEPPEEPQYIMELKNIHPDHKVHD